MVVARNVNLNRDHSAPAESPPRTGSFPDAGWVLIEFCFLHGNQTSGTCHYPDRCSPDILKSNLANLTRSSSPSGQVWQRSTCASRVFLSTSSPRSFLYCFAPGVHTLELSHDFALDKLRTPSERGAPLRRSVPSMRGEAARFFRWSQFATTRRMKGGEPACAFDLCKRCLHNWCGSSFETTSRLTPFATDCLRSYPQSSADLPCRSSGLRMEVREGSLGKMMQQRDLEIARELHEQLVAAGVPVRQFLLYGSRARGDHSPESDMDVCLVLDSFSPTVEELINRIAWQVGFDAGVVISTIEFTAEELRDSPLRSSPLVKAIRKEGVAV